MLTHIGTNTIETERLTLRRFESDWKRAGEEEELRSCDDAEVWR